MSFGERYPCNTHEPIHPGSHRRAFPLDAAWQAGAASVDITPTESIWLAGYASRTKPSESVRQPIHCKALALKDDAGAVSVIVTLDLSGSSAK